MLASTRSTSGAPPVAIWQKRPTSVKVCQMLDARFRLYQGQMLQSNIRSASRSSYFRDNPTNVHEIRLEEPTSLILFL